MDHFRLWLDALAEVCSLSLSEHSLAGFCVIYLYMSRTRLLLFGGRCAQGPQKFEFEASKSEYLGNSKSQHYMLIRT